MIVTPQFRLREWIAEGYLLASIGIYWLLEGVILNPIAICLSLVLLCMVFVRKALLNWVIAFIFLLLNLYMVLAMIDELNEFTMLNKRAGELLVGGSLYLGANIFAAILLLVKWGRRTRHYPNTSRST